ncbi:DUF6042 family protein [Streptomyces sp. NPDC058855]|uniref:DUF6042 family protein n=1 Tax=Streptomyces sp. NPDC058855 TaxID=3346651 RepID=UPI0036B72F44
MTAHAATAGATEDLSSAVFMHPDWFESGWNFVLPKHQSFLLALFLSTAVRRGLSGTLEEVAEEVGADGLLDRLGGSLDAPVRWMEPDGLGEDGEDAAQEEAAIRAEAEASRAACEEALRAAGLPLPTTVRGLAETMTALGIASRQDGIWVMPERLPLPEDVLTLPDGLRARLRELRHVQAVAPAEQALVAHLTDGLGHPAEVFTSIDRLARALGLTEDETRGGLQRLVDTGDVRLERGLPRVGTTPGDLASHERFHLVPDWDHFHAHRVFVHRA